MIVYAVVVFFIVYEIFRTFNERANTLVLECRYDLFAVRDSLRDLALKGEVDSNSWLFKCLDQSIGRFIEFLPTLTIYKMLFLYFLFKRNQESQRSINFINAELGQPQNTVLKEINDRYTTRIARFLIQRDAVISFTLHVVIFFILGPAILTSTLQKMKKVSARVVESPQTPLILEPVCV